MRSQFIKGTLLRGRRLHNESGATLVEAAISAPVFFFIVLVGVGLLVTSYRVAALHYSLMRTARFAALGLTMPGALNRQIAIENRLIDEAGGFGVRLTPEDILVCRESPDFCLFESAAGPNEFVYIGATDSISLPFGKNISYTLSVIARNEPFI